MVMSESEELSDRETKVPLQEWTEYNRSGNMRQKRTKSPLMKQVEEMRHHAQIDTGTKMNAPDLKKQVSQTCLKKPNKKHIQNVTK